MARYPAPAENQRRIADRSGLSREETYDQAVTGLSSDDVAELADDAEKTLKDRTIEITGDRAVVDNREGGKLGFEKSAGEWYVYAIEGPVTGG